MGNRWVTLFPPCCLPGICIHPRCWNAYYPLALFPLVKWACCEMLICCRKRTRAARGPPAPALWSTRLPRLVQRRRGGGQGIHLMHVIITVSVVICDAGNGLFSTCGRGLMRVSHVHRRSSRAPTPRGISGNQRCQRKVLERNAL